MLARRKISSSMQISDTINMYERYAIYYLPSPDSALAKFARDWFGYDYESQTIINDRRSFGLSDDFLDHITRQPKRYGLHSTLKAPFYLDENKDAASLSKRLEGFCLNRKKFEIEPLKLTQLGDFLALTLAGDNSKIDQLASQCVLGFDEFRAPLSVAERTRRLASNLTTHQRLMLESHGYPYVLSEFNFHITLTSRLTAEEKEKVFPILEQIIAEITQSPLKIDAIALVGDPGRNAPFHVLERFPLSD